MTQRIYETNSEISAFNARVTSCTLTENGYEITLDKTAFFPTGGGQSCDTGRIGQGRVSDVFLRENEVIHVSALPLEAGKEYPCVLDYEDRLIKMRSHTAEHILSSFFARTRGMKNVGFHLGSLDTTCDFDGEISQKEITSAEDYVNSVIMQNIPVHPYFPSEEELKNINYRSKGELDGQIRLVMIGENGEKDICACCAPHVSMTGQIGLFKITDFYRYKGGTRVHLLTGDKALSYVRKMESGIKTLSVALSRKPEPDDVLLGVDHLTDEIKNLKFSLNLYSDTLCSEISKTVKEDMPFVFFTEITDGNFLTSLCREAMKKASFSAVFGGKASSYRFVIGGEGSEKILSSLKARFDTRGGGKDIKNGSINGEKAEIEQAILS